MVFAVRSNSAMARSEGGPAGAAAFEESASALTACPFALRSGQVSSRGEGLDSSDGQLRGEFWVPVWCVPRLLRSRAATALPRWGRVGDTGHPANRRVPQGRA